MGNQRVTLGTWGTRDRFNQSAWDSRVTKWLPAGLGRGKLIIKTQSLRAVASAGLDDTPLGYMQLRGNLPLTIQPR